MEHRSGKAWHLDLAGQVSPLKSLFGDFSAAVSDGPWESFTAWPCLEALLKLASDQGMVFNECRLPPVPESQLPTVFAQFQ